MKLKINPDPTFKADVKITVPGQTEPGTLPVTFKYRGRDEYKALLESFQEKTDESGNATQKGKTFAEALPAIATGWGLDEDFTPENIEIFLNNYPAAYQEIFAEYSRLLLVSRIKN